VLQNGRGALHAAARHVAAAKALLQLKADVNQQDDVRNDGKPANQPDLHSRFPARAQDGRTPAMAAATVEGGNVYALLLEASALIAIRAKVWPTTLRSSVPPMRVSITAPCCTQDGASAPSLKTRSAPRPLDDVGARLREAAELGDCAEVDRLLDSAGADAMALMDAMDEVREWLPGPRALRARTPHHSVHAGGTACAVPGGSRGPIERCASSAPARGQHPPGEEGALLLMSRVHVGRGQRRSRTSRSAQGGYPPLQIAALFGHAETAELLHRLGVGVNEPDEARRQHDRARALDF
jgi:hypothetical protein